MNNTKPYKHETESAENSGDLIAQEQLKILFESLPNSLLATIIATILTAFLLWDFSNRTTVVAWVCSMNIIVLIRWLIYKRYFKSLPISGNLKTWRFRYAASTLMAAFTWGSIAIFLFPEENFAYQTMIGFLLIGIAAVGISSQSAINTIASGFLFLTLAPISFRFIINAEQTGWSPGLLVGLLLILLLSLSKHINKVILQNITLRFKSSSREERWKKSEQKLSHHIHETPLAAIEWTQDGVITQWNPSAESLFGYTKDEALNKHIKDLFPSVESVDGDSTSDWNSLFESNQSSYDTLEIKRKDGKRRICEWYNTPLLGLNNIRTGASSFLMDITERLHAEEDQKRLTEIIQNSTDFIAVFTLEGNILFMNAAGRQIMGYGNTESLEDKSLAGMFPASEIDRVLNEGVPTAFMSRTWTGETSLISIDGEVITVSQLIILHDESKSGTQYFSMVMRDISDRKRAEEELIKAKNIAEDAAMAKSEFLAMMSHEIRTPMNGVLGMTELLKDTALNNEQQEFLGIIHQSGNSLLKIINDILDYSKAEAGKIEFELISFDLERAIHDVVRLLSTSAASKGIELIIDYPIDIPRQVTGDAGRIRQIITNLTGNAIKFTSSGHVAISVKFIQTDSEHEHFRIMIEDTGIGISENQQRKLFKSFTQADSSTTRKYGGTGLGLSICKQLVELMGGSIGLESTPGKGSKFWFDLSLPASQPPAILPHADLHGTRALIVDENRLNLRVYHDQIIRYGINIDTASSREEALNLIEKSLTNDRHYHIILLDSNFEKTSEESLATDISELDEYSKTSLVLLTSSGTRGDAKFFENQGFAAYLVKPAHSNLLKETLESVLALSLDKSNSSIITRHNIEESHPNTVSKEVQFNAKVLLVEDVIANQKVASIVMRKFGLEVDIADNGLTALERISETNYDLVFMDCQMPKLDGYETTIELRKREKNVNHRLPIIALTANQIETEKQRCIASGMDDFLGKPFEWAELVAILDKWLNKPSSQPSDILDSQPPVPVDLSPRTIIDEARLASMKELMGDDYIELFPAFFDSFSSLRAILPGALENNNHAEVRRITHSLKSASNNVGAVRLANIAQDMEQDAAEEKLTRTQDRLPQLDAEAQKVKDRLNEIISAY
ncbi:MAG: response regulator [gamma proteobacterium endosymbiont of Lamellibrachia anaximandri]|nr:response regulator [gamma proteobacterium endosymbiont of Lamellibrachia anaximandri]